MAVLAFLAMLVLAEGLLRWTGIGRPVSLVIPLDDPAGRTMIDNDAFTRPFFTRGLTRDPCAIRFPHPKPANEYRVVVLGASAAMGDPMPEFGLPRMLQAMLEARYTNRQVRVINAALTAINSHVVRILSEELVRYEPDAAVIYLGNNEMVGPYGPGSIFHAGFRSQGWIRASILLRRTRLGQLMSGVAARVAARTHGPAAWAGMEMFLDKPLPENNPGVARAVRHFEANLGDITTSFQARDIPVILSTVAVNLDDFPPLNPPPDTRTWTEAQDAERQGDREQAWTLYQKACDEDRFRFRADTAINAAIRRVAQDGADRGIRLVDAASGFRTDYLAGQSGATWFVDHVHFTLEGNHRLASMIIETWPGDADAAEAPPLGLQECRERLGYSPWQDLHLWKVMADRRKNPPFTSQGDHIERMIDLARRINRAEESARTPGERARWIGILARETGLHPDDAELQLLLGRLRMAEARFEDALNCFRRARELWPHRITPAGHAACAQTLISSAASAQTELRGAWRGSAFRMPDVYRYVASLLADNGEWNHAESWLAGALTLDPGDPESISELAAVCLKQGKPDEALKLLGTLDGSRHPQPGKLASLKGVLLGELGQWPRAIDQFELAIRSSPSDPEILYRAGRAAREVGDEPHAMELLRKALTIHPADREAALLLADLEWQSRQTGPANGPIALLRRIDPKDAGLRLRHALLLARMGRTQKALEILSDEGRIPCAEQSPEALALGAWLSATSDAATGHTPDCRQDFLRKTILDRRRDRDARGLIPPAIAAHEARWEEANQRLTAAAVFMETSSPELDTLMQQLRETIAAKQPFRMVPSDRIHDPVLNALWPGG